MNKKSGMEEVRIVEVGPRDGLQNEKSIIKALDKIKFIQLLSEAGLKTIEIGSFVRKEKIPQMQDTAEVFAGLDGRLKSQVSLPCLVPNLKGLEAAIKCGVKDIAIFTSTSETFNKKNIDCSIEESLEKLRPVAVEALKNDIRIRGYISTVFGCPYEGKTSLDVLKKVANRLFDFGVFEISFGDTIGVAHPMQVQTILEALKKNFDLDQLVMHFHDTYGAALANVWASYEAGIRSFDSSAGGLGGCPYAKGATGNVATEDLLHLFGSMEVETGVSIEKVIVASSFILQKIGRDSLSKAHVAYKKKINK